MTMDDLNCGILTISFSTVIDRGCNNTNSYDATVCCCKCINISSILIIFATDTTRIWNSNPFPGLIRLQWGSYSNQGHVEVYCNWQWEQYVILMWKKYLVVLMRFYIFTVSTNVVDKCLYCLLGRILNKRYGLLASFLDWSKY